MKTVTATLNAFVPEYRQESYVKAKAENDQFKMVDVMAFAQSEMSGTDWVKIGTAEITVTLHDDDTVRDDLVASLKEKKSKVLAEAQAEATRIEEKIQSLLAISWDGK